MQILNCLQHFVKSSFFYIGDKIAGWRGSLLRTNTNFEKSRLSQQFNFTDLTLFLAIFGHGEELVEFLAWQS